jgi:hypothetical protein
LLAELYDNNVSLSRGETREFRANAVPMRGLL